MNVIVRSSDPVPPWTIDGMSYAGVVDGRCLWCEMNVAYAPILVYWPEREWVDGWLPPDESGFRAPRLGRSPAQLRESSQRIIPTAQRYTNGG